MRGLPRPMTMTGFVFRIFQEELYIAAAGREIRMENKGKKQNGLGGGGGWMCWKERG
jgi:hypothetical protein